MNGIYKKTLSSKIFKVDVNPRFIYSTQSAGSSSVWMVVSLFLLAVTMVLLMSLAIVTAAALCWVKSKKPLSKDRKNLRGNALNSTLMKGRETVG